MITSDIGQPLLRDIETGDIIKFNPDGISDVDTTQLHVDLTYPNLPKRDSKSIFLHPNEENEEDLQEFKDRSWLQSSEYLLPLLGNRPWSGHIFIAGPTRSGKSWIAKDILNNDTLQRHIFLFSDIKTQDRSFKILFRKGRITKVGREDIPRIREMHDVICVFDDQTDKEINAFRDHLLEQGRHQKVMVVVITHALRDRAYTKKPTTDSEWIITFPDSNSTTVKAFLRDKHLLGSGLIKKVVRLAQEDGKGSRGYLMIHNWAPQLMVTKKSVIML